MNDLEIIQHWAIRAAIVRWTVAFIVSAIIAAGCSLISIACSVDAMILPAVCAWGAAVACNVRLGRLWKRLTYLEQFIS